MFKAAGAITDEELVTGFRRFGSPLQGHPTPALPWVDVATGSLGQGLPYGVGIALAGRHLDKLPYQVWVLCGDSEMAEGSMWEALDKAAYYQLGNLTAIVDVNRLGQRGPTELEWDMAAYQRRAEAFGCAAVVIDGHDITQIDQALAAARDAARPVVVLARTVKGKGFAEIEDKNGWHGRPLPADMAQRAVAALGGERNLHVTTARPAHHDAPRRPEAAAVTLPRYQMSSKVATRKAYGDALVALGARPEVVALDGEVGNSTYAGQFAAAYPDRFFEMFIAEQQLIAAAVGLAVRGYVPFASTFAAFFSRGYDFLRMAGISGANIKLCGSHAGTEIGPDGPSQMALEDLAALRAIHGSTVLYPADATAAAALTAQMADTPGIVYLRSHAGRLAGPLPGWRGLPSRRQQGAARRPQRRGHPDRGGRHRAPVPARRRRARRRRDRGPDHRPVLGQARRPGHPGRRPRRRPAGGWSSPRTTTPRAASAPPCSRRSPGPACRCGSGSARSAACPAPGRRTS